MRLMEKYAILTLDLGFMEMGGKRMKMNLKTLSLLLWVTQFGFSVLFPVCSLLLLAVYLCHRFGFGVWLVAVLGILGLLISFSTARSCLRSLRRDAEDASDGKEPPVSFNEHI